MNPIMHDSQVFIKPKQRNTKSFLDGRPRISQGSSRGVQLFSSNTNRPNPNHLKVFNLKLNWKDSAGFHPTKVSLIATQTVRNSRPSTASNTNKQRLSTAKSNEKYKLTINTEEQKQNSFGPTVKKLYTPLNYKWSMLIPKCMPEPFTDRNPGGINNYLIGKDIGKGAYAVVKYGIHKPTNRKVAIKIYDKAKFQESNRLKNAHREIEILQQLNHSNILKLYEFIETE